MALEIVRRFVNGAWKTEAAEESGGGSLPANWTIDDAGNLLIIGGDGGVLEAPLTVRASPGSTAIIIAENELEESVFDVDKDGNFNTRGAISMGPGTADGTVCFVDGSSNTLHDIIQARTPGGETAGVSLDGALFTSLRAAPVDATFFTRRLMIWFDDTHGAAKLMIKAKDSNDSFVTGSVPLS